MSDLFRRTEVDFGGAMTAEKGFIVPNNGLTGVLMQNLGLQYSQNVTRIYELGRIAQRTRVYYVGGRAAGNLSVAHVIGPGVALQQFYDNFSDVCQACNNDIKLQLATACGDSTCAPFSGVAYNAKFCVLVSIGMAVASQDFVITEQAQLMFSSLERTNVGANGVAAPSPAGTVQTTVGGFSGIGGSFGAGAVSGFDAANIRSSPGAINGNPTLQDILQGNVTTGP